MGRSIGGSILKGAAIVSASTLLSKFMGIVQKIVIAHQFGTGMAADVFSLVSQSIVGSMVVIPQKLMAPFLPLFVDERERHGAESAWRFASTIGTLLVIVVGMAVVVGMSGPEWIVRKASKFTTPEAVELGAGLLRIMLPAVLLAAMFSLGALLMNARKHFALPAMGDAINKMVVVVTLLILGRYMGIRGIAVGVILGAAVGLLLMAGGLRREIGSIRPNLNLRTEPMRRMGRLALPVLVGLLVAQVVRNWFDYWLASGMGEGYAASLTYARGLSDTIVALVASAVGTVIYPYFSDMATGDRKEESRDALMGTLRMMTFVFVPLSVALIVVRQPLIQVIFERGRFTAESVGLTTAPFAFYTAGLTAAALEIILMQFYFSRKDTLTPIVVGLVCFAVHVGIVLHWKETMLHSSMAMGLVISKTIKVGILLVLLRYKLPALCAKANMFFLGKMIVVGLAMAGAMYGIQEALAHVWTLPSSAGHFHKVLFLGTRMAVVGAVGGLVFTVLVLAIRIREASLILEFCRRRIGRGRQNANPGSI